VFAFLLAGSVFGCVGAEDPDGFVVCFWRWFLVFCW